MHLPPSTSKTTPVIILASSEHKKHAAFPISCGVEKRPMGIVDKNDCFFFTEFPPINDFNNGVNPATGAIAFTLTLCGANSIAIAFVAVIIHPLLALYQFNFGLGDKPAVDATFKIIPFLILSFWVQNIFHKNKLI